MIQKIAKAQVAPHTPAGISTGGARPLPLVRSIARFLPMLTAAAATLVATSSLDAAIVTKASTGTDLTDGASWGGTAPILGDVATWISTSLGAGLTAATGVTWDSINITGAIGNIGITGAGAITTGNITLSGGRTLSIANAVALSGNSIYTIADATNSAAIDTTLSGIVSGAFSLTKEGAGTLALSNVGNSFSGNTVINGGELRSSEGTSATGTLTTFGTGSITVNSGATLRFAAGSTTNQYTYINAINLNSATLAFEDGNHILTGGIALTGANTITGVFAGKNLTIANPITGSGSLNKTTSVGQDAVLLLQGANTYSGGTTVTSGTLTLDFTGAASPVSDILLSTGAVTLAGGNLTVLGKAATANTQTFPGLSLAANTASTLTVTPGATGGTATLNLGALTRNANSFLNVAGTGTVLTTLGAASTLLTDATTGAAYATVGGTDWAAKNAANTSIVGLSTLGGYTSFTTGTVTLSGNADFTGAASTYTLAGNSTPATIRNIAITGNALALGGFTLATGGLLSSQTLTISGAGALTAAIAGGELLVDQTANTTTITAAIADNTSASSLTKAGTGNVTLIGTETYTGATNVLAGTLQLGSGTSGGAGNLTGTSGISISAGATLGLGNGSLSATQNISGAGNVAKNGSFTTNFTIAGTNNNYTGTTSVTVNTLTLSAGGVINGTSSITIATINNASVTNNGTITALGALTMSGGNATSGIFTNNATGTLNVASISMAAGSSFINNGTLNVGAGGLSIGGAFTLGAASTFTDAAGTITINSGGLVTFGSAAQLSPITNPNGITLNSGGTLVASGALTTVTGWINSGYLLNTSAGAIAITASSSENIDFTGFNSLGLAATNTLAVYSGTITPGTGGYQFGGSTGTNLTVSPVLFGANTVNKSGLSTLTLTGANSFSGNVNINGGFVAASTIGNVGANGPFGTNGLINITTGTGGVLYTGVGETTTQVVRYNSASAGGFVTNIGTGALTFSSSFTSAATAGYGVTFNGTGNTSIVGITQTGTPQLINFNQTGTGQTTVTGSLDLNTGALRANAGVLNIASTATVGLTGTSGHSGAITNTIGGVLKIQSGATVYTSTANTNSILGGWATFNDTTWVVAAGAATAVSGLATFDTSNALVAAANEDVSASFTASSGASTNSLRFNSANSVTVTLTGANVITSGGILETAAVGSNPITITGGTSLATGITGGNVIIHQNNTAASLTIGSVIAANGTGGLTKSGAGRLILNGNNLFTGAAYLLEGTVQIGNAGALGTTGATNISAGATLDLNGITFARALTLAGAGVGGSSTLINSSVTPAIASGAITLANYATLGGANAITLSGVISDTNALGQRYGFTKAGLGTLTLSNTGNTFTGNVVISTGTLTTSANQANNNTGQLGANNTTGRIITASSGATLSILGNNLLGGSTQTLANTPTLIINQGGTVTNANYNVVGNINLNGGTLTQTVANTAGYAGYEFNGSTVTVRGANVSTISGTGGIGLGGKTLTLDVGDVTSSTDTDLTVSPVLYNTSPDRSGAGSLLKIGLGTVTLSGANNFSGGTTVNAGTIITQTPNGSANGALGAGNITVNSGGTILAIGDNSFVGGTSSSAKTITINTGGTITTDSGSGHLNALVLNGGTLSATTARGDYGNWDLDQGVSTLGGTATTSTISGGNATLSQIGGTIFNVQGTDTLNVSTVLASTAFGTDLGLIKSGSGTLVLSGTNTYTSATSVNNGTLVFAVNETLTSLDIADGATVILGAPAPAPALEFGPGAASLSAAAVPEPGSAVLMMSGLLAMFGLRRKSL